MPGPEDALTERARTARLDAAEADLAGVEVALERLDAGSYATCERCGSGIDEARLARQPITRTCASCEPS